MVKKKMVILIAAFLLPCYGCAVNPVTGENQLMLLAPSDELRIGQQYAPEVEKQLGGRIDNPKLQNYINGVGQRIAGVSHMPSLRFYYTAVNDESINAMALPGGYVFITTGMLEKLSSESQLAAILAHETVHITARHSAQSMSNQIGMDILLSAITSEKTPQSLTTVSQLGGQLIHLSHSREHELQADSFGLDYLAGAGYNPNAMIETMEILEQQNSVRPFEYFSTHPSPANRKKKLLEYIADKGYSAAADTEAGRAVYEKFVLANLGRH